MPWAETIVDTLKKWDTSLIAYVPDISIDRVTSIINEDPFFHLVSCTREEEAIGVAVGSYAVGRNAAVFMQSSGFGNSVNGGGQSVSAGADAHSHLHEPARTGRRVQHLPGRHGPQHHTHPGPVRHRQLHHRERGTGWTRCWTA